jgi:hypothetical protein
LTRLPEHLRTRGSSAPDPSTRVSLTPRGRPGRAGYVPLSDITTRELSHVVTGTAATSPIEPIRVRTISTATTSELAMNPRDCDDNEKKIRRGSEAPAYARRSVLTVDTM